MISSRKQTLPTKDVAKDVAKNVIKTTKNDKRRHKTLPDKNNMTREGYEKLKAELIELRTTERTKIAEALEYSRSFGDLSENAEYITAREAQAILEYRIAKLEEALRQVKVVDEIKGNVVENGVIVSFTDIKTKKKFTYQIVSTNESDPKNGKISSLCPIGSALFGLHVGEVGIAKTPQGIVHLRVDEIHLPNTEN